MAATTHAVMTSGTQISSPVMKYFFTASRAKKLAARYLAGGDAAADDVAAGVPVLEVVPVGADGTLLLPLEASDAGFDEESDLVSPLVSVFTAALAVPPPLKSVAYQPVPFN